MNENSNENEADPAYPYGRCRQEYYQRGCFSYKCGYATATKGTVSFIRKEDGVDCPDLTVYAIVV